MPQKCETPLAGGATRYSLAAFRNIDSPQPKIEQPFTDHRQAAFALLNSDQGFIRNAARFLGQLLVDSSTLSERQANWLAQLLDKHGLPPLARQEGQ